VGRTRQSSQEAKAHLACIAAGENQQQKKKRKRNSVEEEFEGTELPRKKGKRPQELVIADQEAVQTKKLNKKNKEKVKVHEEAAVDELEMEEELGKGQRRRKKKSTREQQLEVGLISEKNEVVDESGIKLKKKKKQKTTFVEAVEHTNTESDEKMREIKMEAADTVGEENLSEVLHPKRKKQKKQKSSCIEIADNSGQVQIKVENSEQKIIGAESQCEVPQQRRRIRKKKTAKVPEVPESSAVPADHSGDDSELEPSTAASRRKQGSKATRVLDSSDEEEEEEVVQLKRKTKRKELAESSEEKEEEEKVTRGKASKSGAKRKIRR
jgi:hypothetical protein